MTRSTSWAAAFDDVGWKLPEILTVDATARAVEHLKSYMRHVEHKGPEYSGSWFHRLGGGGDREDIENVITSDDLVSLNTLNARAGGQEAIALLTDLSDWDRPEGPLDRTVRDSTSHRLPINPDQVTSIPRQIGTDLRLEDLTEDEFARFQALWDDLFWSLRRKKFGPVAVFKLCARKRPHLIPIYDTYVKMQLGIKNPQDFTAHLYHVLRHDDGAFARHLAGIRSQVDEAADLSLIRIFDIVVWREQEQRGKHT
ncbi:DUF6308 family protein [Corynebacterium nasicanis]|uniref:DUF6308 family protein n=1 Tax=Corynebacterium nasicanis TaxID=1448267 RepID=A0ABW1Q914_9CORY